MPRTFGGWFTVPEEDSPYFTKVPQSHGFRGVGNSTTHTTSWVTIRKVRSFVVSLLPLQQKRQITFQWIEQAWVRQPSHRKSSLMVALWDNLPSSLHLQIAFFRVTLWFKLGDKAPAIKSDVQVLQKEGGRWQVLWLFFWMDTDFPVFPQNSYMITMQVQGREASDI